MSTVTMRRDPHLRHQVDDMIEALTQESKVLGKRRLLVRILTPFAITPSLTIGFQGVFLVSIIPSLELDVS